jgi:hypothetical protein
MKQHKKEELIIATLGAIMLFVALYFFVKGIMF